MANQKMKTKRAAAKRFKVTKRKRNLRKSTLVDETNVKTMKKIMPYA